MFHRYAPVVAVVLACAVSPVRADDKPHKMTRVYSVADLVIPIPEYDAPPLGVTKSPCCPGCCATVCAEPEVMCQQPEESCCPNGACCPDGPCCPNGACCTKGCCEKCITNWSAIAAPECYPATKAAAKPTAAGNAELLIKLITNTIRPDCWTTSGGECTIEYCPNSYGLVVNASPDVHEQVADILDALQRLRDVEVAIEIKFVSVGDDMYSKCFENNAAEGPTMLCPVRLKALVDELQSDQHTSIMAAPKLTLFNGQKSVIQVMNQQYLSPNEIVSTGVRAAVRATATADHQAVRCELTAEMCNLDGTELAKRPKVIKRGVTKSLTIPTEKTAVLYAGKQVKPGDGEELDATEHLLVLVTPRVIVNSETQQKADARPMPVGPATMNPRNFIWGAGCHSDCGSFTSDLDIPIRPGSFQYGTPAVPGPQEAPTGNLMIGCGVNSGCCASACPSPVAVCPALTTPQVATPPMFRQCSATDLPACQQQNPPVCYPVAPCPCPPRIATAIPPVQPSVQLDVCVMRMDPDAWKNPTVASWDDLSPKAGDGKHVVAPEEALRFVRTMKSLGVIEVLSEPKLVTLCGQPATFVRGGQQLSHNFTLASQGGKLVTQSVPEVIPFGTKVTCVADMMPEGIYLQCECATSAALPVKEYKVTIEGPDGESRTEAVLLAGDGHESHSRIAAAVPTGKTLLLHCGRDADGKDVIVTVTPQVIGAPAVFTAAPIFRGQMGVEKLEDPTIPVPTGNPRCDNTPAVAVPTMCPAVPTVMAPPLPRVATCPMPAPPPAMLPAAYTMPVQAYQPQLVTGQFAPPGSIDSKLERLMTKYRWACEDGDNAEARKLAQQCLAIDPTCFGK
jgi:hypothetical protein